MDSSNHRLAEQKSIIWQITSALHSLSTRLNGATTIALPPVALEASVHAPHVSFSEATSLVEMITEVLAANTTTTTNNNNSHHHHENSDGNRTDVTDPAVIAALVCDAHPFLVPILCSFLQSPQAVMGAGKTSSVDPSASSLDSNASLADFYAAVLRCLIDLVCLCVSNVQDAGWVQLGESVSSMLVEVDVLHLLLPLLTPSLPDEVQKCAAEFLFTIMVRMSATVRPLMGDPETLGALFAALDAQESPILRAFLAACVRELANTNAPALVQHAPMSMVIRLAALDPSSDVRTLAIETLDTVYGQDPAAFLFSPHRRELLSVLLDRLEKESNVESMVACLKFLETVLQVDAQLHPQFSPQNGSALASASQSGELTELLVGGQIVPMLLTVLTQSYPLVRSAPSTQDPEEGQRPVRQQLRSACLAARCLRLVVQTAPSFLHTAFAVIQDFSRIAELLKLTVAIAAVPVLAAEPEQDRTCRAEIGILLSLCFAQDPRCRQLLASQLHDHPQYVAQLRSAIYAHMDCVPLTYYAPGIEVIDVNGNWLNDPSGVEWEQADRPSKQSIEYLFQEQEETWAQQGGPNSHPRDGHNNEASTGGGRSAAQALRRKGRVQQVEYTRLQRLTFIVLGYATFDALQDAPQQGDRGEANELHTPYAAVEDSSAIQQQGASPSTSITQQQQAPPVPTRTSMLREWRQHPDKFAMLERMTAQQLAQGGERTPPLTPRPQSQPSYRQQNLVPSQQQHLKSGQQPHPSQTRGASPSQSRRVAPQKHVDAQQQQPRQGSLPQAAAASPRREALYSKFECAFKLAQSFSKFFQSSLEVKASAAAAASVYETTGDGFARRAAQSTSRTPSSAGGSIKAWSLAQLKEGDLFHFAIPLEILSCATLEQVRSHAIRHLNLIKKSFIVTPHAAKARRWFLYDMAHHIMPGIIHTISQCIDVFSTHGDEAAKFPILMFREKELQQDQTTQQQQQGGGIAAGGARPSSAMLSLHSGNLLEVLDQLAFYFAKVQQQQQLKRSSNGRSSLDRDGPSTYLRDLDMKIAQLSAMKFDGKGAGLGGGGGLGGSPQAVAPYGSTASALFPAAAARGGVGVTPSLPASFQYNSDDDD